MLAKKHIKYGAAVLLLCAVVLGGCKSTSSATKTAKPMKLEAGKELAAWKGEWQSYSAITGASQLNDVYKKEAENLQYYTEDGLKAITAKMLASPVVRAVFDGSNTVMFTVLDADGNEKQVSCEYRYVGDAPVAGAEQAGLAWQTFEAVKVDHSLSQMQYLIVFPPHQDSPDDIMHWHARFGAKDIKSLVEDRLWWPTFVDGSFTKEALIKQLIPEIEMIAQKMLPKESFAAYTGKWINSSLIYDDQRPAVQKVYDQLIKEFSGKKDGSDFTKADIIAMMKKTYGTASDFTHLEFITTENKNELVVWKDKVEVSRVTYKRDGDNKLRATANSFTADDQSKAGKFAYVSMTTPHGKPAHMHVWHGMKPSDIDKVGKPTCIPVDSPEEEVASRVEYTCRRALKEATK